MWANESCVQDMSTCSASQEIHIRKDMDTLCILRFDRSNSRLRERFSDKPSIEWPRIVCSRSTYELNLGDFEKVSRFCEKYLEDCLKIA